jgi:hypothetical protein
MVKKKTIMESFRIDEISGVDRPAQEGAKALLIKRAKPEDLEKGWGYSNPFLLSEVDGHTHILDDDGSKGGETSWSKSEGEEGGHTHPWVRDLEGRLVIGMSEGHTHNMTEKRFEPEDDEYSKRDFSADERRKLAKEGKALPDGSFPIVSVADLRNAIKAFGRAKNKGLVAKHIKRRARALGAESELPKEGALALKSLDNGLQKEQVPMAKENEKTVEAVEKQLQESQDALAIAKAFGELNDAEKSLYAKMSSDEQAAFLKMDASGRKSAVEKAAGENPVIYTSLDGDEFRKNDDPRLVKAAKRADEAEKIAKAEREKREDADLAKRAEDGMQNLPGDLDVKKAVLKAVDGIEDQSLREGALALLKAGNENLADAFKKMGESGEPESSSLEAEYEKLAEEYAKEKDVDLVTAKADVLTESAKGRDLAKRMEDERRSKGL